MSIVLMIVNYCANTVVDRALILVADDVAVLVDGRQVLRI